MCTLNFLLAPNYVLTHEGLFFKRSGDLLRAVQILSQHRIIVSVIDTQFAFLLEEAQKRKVLYEPYRDYMDAGRHAGYLMKDRTLLSMNKEGASQFFKGCRGWEYELGKRVSKELGLILMGQVGMRKARKQLKPCPKNCSYSKSTIQNEYYFAEGLFFQTTKELEQAISILEPDNTFDGVLMSSKQALVAYYVQVALQGKTIQGIDLIQFSAKILKRDHLWFDECRNLVKEYMLNEMDGVYHSQPYYFKKIYSRQFEPGVETECLREDLMDEYSPALRPDLYKQTVIPMGVIAQANQEIAKENIEKWEALVSRFKILGNPIVRKLLT